MEGGEHNNSRGGEREGEEIKIGNKKNEKKEHRGKGSQAKETDEDLWERKRYRDTEQREKENKNYAKRRKS